MRYLHRAAAWAIVAMIILFVYMEYQKSTGAEVVTSVTKTKAQGKRESKNGD